MRKIGILFLTLLMVMSLTLTGCLVSKSKYNTVVTERDDALSRVTSLQNDVEKLTSNLTAAQSRIDELQNNLAALQSKADKLESDYEAANSRISTLQNDVSRAQGDYGALKSKLDKAKIYAEILDKYMFAYADEATALQALNFVSLVEKTGDTVVKDKLTAYYSSPTIENSEAFWSSVWDGLWVALWGPGT